MRSRGRAPAVVAVCAVSLVLAAPAGAADLMARARRDGSVRVLARLPVAPQPLALRGTRAGDEANRIAIRGARDRLEEDLADTGWEVTRPFESIPYVALDVGPDALARLQLTDKIEALGEDRLEKVLLRESVPLIQADQAHAAGYDGTGWTVAVLDTGVDGSHPFLQGRIVSEACYSANRSCPNGQATQIGAGSGAPCAFAPNACPHGTHVAGVVAGRGETTIGVAPGASLIAIQVFSRFTGDICDDDVEDPCAKTFTSDTIAALDRVYQLRDTFQIAAVNMSLGGGEYSSVATCEVEDAARKAIVDQLRSVGIATVAASGNGSLTNGLAAPACIDAVVSVGATNDLDQVASFSDSAPFLDLLAPGVQILSSVPGGQGAIISGTSQATPHVSGAFALLSQRLGHADPNQVLNALVSTGVPVRDPRNDLTKPRIEVFDAIQSLPGGEPASGLQVTPDGKRRLISKDVGNQRWAITLNPDGTVTGNVYKADGGEPSFVWCSRSGDDGNPDPYEVQIDFACSGADPCPGPSCTPDQWSFIDDVTIGGFFFQPPRPGSTNETVAPPSGIVPDAPSGLQVTPDGARTLVSKDVNGERWAITRNEDDGSVTGNVIRPEQDPAFLWCERTGDNGDPDPANVLITYSCQSAERCESGPCDPAAWTFLREVVVPGWFFLP
ncbi:MAG: hypothetical protein FJ144_20670 [Deltaproteobacteria bacterium]|nr:hypothetical protein [Deltaproteobacteria bacterium]